MSAVLCVVFSCLATAQQLPELQPLTNQRIVDLVHSGVQSNELARIIASARDVSFDLTPSGTDALLRAGVSEDIIRAMAARESGARPLEGTGSRPPGQTPMSSPIGSPTSPDTDNEFIERGRKDIALSGTVVVPHSATSLTSGFGSFRLGYYVARNSLVGVDVSVAASNDAQLYIPSGFYRYLQHTRNPRFFPFVGAAAGGLIAHGSSSLFGTGITDSVFATRAEAGIKYFVAQNVSFDTAYNLLYAHIGGAGFKDSSASLLVFGFSLTF
jgi:hypothetical protein